MSQKAPLPLLSPALDVSVGPLQYACLSALWKLGPSTVGQVHEDVNTTHQRAKKLAYTTILTVMRNLERRAICTRSRCEPGEKGQRTHVYKPKHTREKFHKALATQFLKTYFDGDLATMAEALEGKA